MTPPNRHESPKVDDATEKITNTSMLPQDLAIAAANFTGRRHRFGSTMRIHG